ncbi:MAG: hypothetical protein M5R42_19960 [Rhodocyclaceae bacterium]|nr:hypothetical protein [Rhodocyclaceae bacterium]
MVVPDLPGCFLRRRHPGCGHRQRPGGRRAVAGNGHRRRRRGARAARHRRASEKPGVRRLRVGGGVDRPGRVVRQGRAPEHHTPARVLRRIDAAARAAGESRSGFIAHLALRD